MSYEHPDGNSLYQAESDTVSLLCYALPDGDALERHLRRQFRRRSPSPEYRWYWRVLQQAANAWASIVNESAIVVLRRVVGGSVEDREVTESLGLAPNWLVTIDDKEPGELSGRQPEK